MGTEPTAIRAIVIPQASDEPISEKNLMPTGDGCLKELQSLVGGMIETILWHDAPGNATAYFNEEGKYLEACEPNARATHALSASLHTWDSIHGDVVIIGIDMREGDTVSLSSDVTVGLIEQRCGK